MTDEDQEQQEKLTRRERRAQSKGGSGASDEVRDRNLRLRADAASERKKQRYAERATAMGEGLGAGERVDHALVRSSEMAGKFVRSNFAWLQWMVVLGVGVAIYIPIMRYRNNVDGEKNGHALAAALSIEFAKIASDEPAEARDPRLVDTRTEYASLEERSKDAMAAWLGLKGQTPEILLGARLAAANAQYDQKQYPEALVAYEKILKDKGIGQNALIKLHALEGVGFCLEAQAKYPEALEAFKKLDQLDDRESKQLGRFHMARVHHLLSQDDQAKVILVELNTALSKAKTDPEGTDGYLAAAVRELLRYVDPSFAVKERQELEKKQAEEQSERLRQMIEEMKKKNGNLSFPGLPDVAPPQTAALGDAAPAAEPAPTPPAASAAAPAASTRLVAPPTQPSPIVPKVATTTPGTKPATTPPAPHQPAAPVAPSSSRAAQPSTAQPSIPAAPAAPVQPAAPAPVAPVAPTTPSSGNN